MNEITDGTKEGRTRCGTSPTEEGTFCPLCDLTFSLPRARRLSKGPLRTLAAHSPHLPTAGWWLFVAPKRRGAGPGAGRDSQPPGPTAGASRAASAHSWKSGGRAGARGSPAAPGEIGRKARARTRARHPPPQPPKTRGRWYRLSRKVSIAALRAHRNPGA